MGLLVVLMAQPCHGQRYFFAALGGISTLSADGATRLDTVTAVSLYKPENGPAWNVAAGAHWNDWISVQANYIWNRNDLAITEIRDLARLEQDRRATQNAAIFDLLLYFRPRRSRIRPYLSAGTGLVHLNTVAAGPVRGDLAPVPPEAASTKLPLRVAVGINLLWRNGWGFRYSFSETRTGNPLSADLSPRGSRGLANFQNLFGLVKYF